MSNRGSASAAARLFPIPSGYRHDVVLLRTYTLVTERFAFHWNRSMDTILNASFIYDAAKKLGSNVIGKYLTKELIVQVLRKMGIRRLTTNQVARYVPIIGQAVSAALSYGAMKLIIRSHINECHRVARTVMRQTRLESSAGG